MRELKGKPISERILADLKEKIQKEKASPGLAVVLVGNDKASKIYVNLKKKRAEEIGIRFELHEFVEEDPQEEIVKKIKELNESLAVNGIIVQLPLPKKFDTQYIIDVIKVEKDVDGFSDKSQILRPVFPNAIMKMMENSGMFLKNKKAVAIVNSKKFGNVMVRALKEDNIEGSYVLQEDMETSKEKIKEADIVITAVGKPEILKEDFLKRGVLIIDGGITERDGKVFGDVDAQSLREFDAILTPVPGGVGPVTIACLLENVYKAYKNQN